MKKILQALLIFCLMLFTTDFGVLKAESIETWEEIRDKDWRADDTITADNFDIIVEKIAEFSGINNFLGIFNIVVDKVKEIEKTNVPTGAVMSFALATCPEGWSEYSPAYGRFIRGIDKSGTYIDADGQRNIESTQEDAIRNIYGSLYGVSGEAGSAWPWGFRAAEEGAINVAAGVYPYNPYPGGGYYPPGGAGSRADFDASRVVPTADENRPKNIALLYCIKD